MARLEHGPALRRRFEERLRTFEVMTLAADGRRPAAVALSLLPDDTGESCFLLTRRARDLRRHGGQWAIPGGRLDPDETPEQTARRELGEELGVDTSRLEELGRLDDFPTRSGFVVTPVLLWSDAPLPLHPDPVEVAAAYRVPLAELDRPEVPLLHEIPESDRPVLSLPLLGQHVHAPTAAILYQMLEVLVRGRTVRVAHYEQPVFAWR